MKSYAQHLWRFAICVVVLGTAFDALAQGRPAVVKVDPVIEEPLAQTAPVLGRIVAREEGSVATRVNGRVLSVEADVGDRLEAGDLIAVLDPTTAELDRDLAEAEYQTALQQVEVTQREIELLRQERDRLERLQNSAAFNRASFDDKVLEIQVAEGRVATDRAEVSEARIRLEQAQTDLEDLRITAPYDGVVTLRHLSAGAYADTGASVVDMVNYRDVEIEADVPANLVNALEPGLTVNAILDNGGSYRAEVRSVIPVENPMTRTRAVRFMAIGDHLPGRAVGQSVTLELPIGDRDDVLTVNKDGVTINQGDRRVFVVEDGKAAPRTVELGRAVGSRFEVISGLVEGDLVVVRGNERLRPGQQVNFEPPNRRPAENGHGGPDGGVTPARASGNEGS